MGLTKAFVVFNSGTDVRVEIGRGKVGHLGNILVKSYIPKSKFDNAFDIRKDYSLNIQNIFAGFSNIAIVGKSLEISRNFSISPLLSKYDLLGAYASGLYPLIHLRLKHFFLRHYDFFFIYKFPKCA